MPNTQRDPYQEYIQKRIPGAQFFGIDEIKDKSSDLPHMLPSKDVFANAVGAISNLIVSDCTKNQISNVNASYSQAN
jgi:hypothetical protein